jgi:hypothetical protein
MKHIILLGMFFLLVIGCDRHNQVTDKEEKPVVIKKVAGSEFDHVILTQESVKRIGLETTAVKIISSTPPKFAIPYSAIIYGLQGETWVYIVVKPLEFVRTPVEIDHIENGVVILTKPPPIPGEIVSVGASELFGSEYIGNIQE